MFERQRGCVDSPPWILTTTPRNLRSAHVIVVGNEKGGAGKSTISIHLAVALLKAGYKVACIDLDTRQQTLTRFFENRRSWSSHASRPIELPRHCAMARGESNDVRANEAHEFALFAEAIGAVEHDYEFVVIDTPASNSYLMRLAHSLADTLVSPLNDSFIDIDVFSRVHHDRSRRGTVAQYADLVIEARRKRRMVDNGIIDWVMVRNRIATIASNNARQVALSVCALGGRAAGSASPTACMTASSSASCFRSASPRSIRSRTAGARPRQPRRSPRGARSKSLLEALDLPGANPGRRASAGAPALARPRRQTLPRARRRRLARRLSPLLSRPSQPPQSRYR